MERILSDSAIETLLGEVNDYSAAVKVTSEACNTVINSFNNKAVVESFYASGKYGQSEQEEIQKIAKAIEKYSNVINESGGLIPQTLSFLETQKSLVSTGTPGGGGHSGGGHSYSGGPYGGNAGGYGSGYGSSSGGTGASYGSNSSTTYYGGSGGK